MKRMMKLIAVTLYAATVAAMQGEGQRLKKAEKSFEFDVSNCWEEHGFDRKNLWIVTQPILKVTKRKDSTGEGEIATLMKNNIVLFNKQDGMFMQISAPKVVRTVDGKQVLEMDHGWCQSVEVGEKGTIKVNMVRVPKSGVTDVSGNKTSVSDEDCEESSEVSESSEIAEIKFNWEARYTPCAETLSKLRAVGLKESCFYHLEKTTGEALTANDEEVLSKYENGLIVLALPEGKNLRIVWPKLIDDEELILENYTSVYKKTVKCAAKIKFYKNAEKCLNKYLLAQQEERDIAQQDGIKAAVGLENLKEFLKWKSLE